MPKIHMVAVGMSRTAWLAVLLTVLFAPLPIDAQDFRSLKPKIKAVLDANNVPGVSVAIVVNSMIVWAEGVGTAEANANRPVVADTMFQAASISKAVAASGALRMVETGSFKLDDQVEPYLKSVRVAGTDKITLRHLLSHTSGLTVHGFGGYAHGQTIATLQQILAGEPPANSPVIQPAKPPGTEFQYSGGGYCVVQQMMIDATAQEFPKLMKTLVLEPLRMNDSTYQQPLPDELLERAAAGHDAAGAMIPGKHNIYPEMAAAGLWTTASDLARFAMAVQASHSGKRSSFLKAATAKQMLTAQVVGGPGLGLFVNGDEQSGLFEHSGVNNGFKAKVIGSKNPGSVLVIMTNSDNGDKVYQPIQELVRASR